MPELKFKAWDKKRGAFLGNHHAVRFDGQLIWLGEASGEYEDYGNTMKNHLILQFTGLKDKNGKEIYFDDIVEFEFHDEKSDEVYGGTALVVETMSFGVGILYAWDWQAEELKAVVEGGGVEDIWEDEDLWTYEVIGNIHENPELITEFERI